MTSNEVLAPVEALAGERERAGNDTPINKHYGVPGVAYCGYTVRYGFEKSGNGAALEKSTNTAYVPTFLAFCRKYWPKVPNTQARKGDVFIYKRDHTGFVFSPYSGAVAITLEGNAMVYATAEQARASKTGSGGFEGIGYKKRYLSADYEVFRPPYSDAAATTPIAIQVTAYRLERRCTGSAVRALQTLLNFRGFGCGKVDGDYGPATAEAVKLFQTHQGLDADGIVGAMTWAKLIG